MYCSKVIFEVIFWKFAILSMESKRLGVSCTIEFIALSPLFQLPLHPYWMLQFQFSCHPCCRYVDFYSCTSFLLEIVTNFQSTLCLNRSCPVFTHLLISPNVKKMSGKVFICFSLTHLPISFKYPLWFKVTYHLI